MDTANINLFVFDTEENFNKSKRFLGEEGFAYKKITCVRNAREFSDKLSSLDEDELVFLAIHVFYTEKLSGIRTFLASGIMKQYPSIGYAFISEGNEKEIKHDMLELNIEPQKIYRYHEIQSDLEEGKLKPNTKKQVNDKLNNNVMDNRYPQIDYAVITALYKDEFQELQKVFEFPENEKIETHARIYYIGYLKSNKSKKIVAAIPDATGMVDSSILSVQMLEFFKPKYVLMSGVCGGSEEFSFGDIIIASQIYTFQKGKISDLNKKRGKGNEKEKIELYDINRELIDYEHLYDEEGKQILVSVEKFEIEHDTIINLDGKIKQKIENKIDDIKHKINREIEQELFFKEKRINIELAPIACSTMVINKEGFFEDTLKVVNRKTAAVEMESYGVARACQLANDGITKPIIFKSVMDNTKNKEDSINGTNVKKFAAYTSAMFMKYLFEENII